MNAELDSETLNVLRKDPLQAALTTSALADFYIAKQFPDNKALITSVDFDITGTHCITTSRDESLRIYDCASGTREQVSYSKKYGCNLAQFTAQPGCVAYASTKINDTVRYLSYETNQFIRYFAGHTGMVTSLQRSPNAQSTSMVSASMDGTVRLWNLDTVKPVCTVNIEGGKNGVAAAYDPSGMVVAVAAESQAIQLYDVRKMTKGPFTSAPITSKLTVAGLKFMPPTGDYILLAMSDGSIMLLDAFQLTTLAVLSSATHNAISPTIAPVASALGQMQQQCFGQKITATPDGRAVIAGNDNGGIVFWDFDTVLANSGSKQPPAVHAPNGTWNGSHDGPVGVCAFNPLLMECVTGSQSLTLWTSIY
ncbi:hypothetical protein IW139_003947 [Coemansia sp. RSA 353]|nr:hypothetical protein EV180_005921 [Coemansia sp. RSA 518]KAJ2295242.1 hypothetical protein IW139_003947 [Coemansia sp. RSA 353]